MSSAFIEFLSNIEHSEFILLPKVHVNIRYFSLELWSKCLFLNFVQTGEKVTMLKETALKNGFLESY